MNTAPSSDRGDQGNPVLRVLTSPYLAVAVAMLFWAGSTVIVRGMREEIPPIGLSFWRTALGAMIVLPFVGKGLIEQWGAIRRHFWIILLLSFLLIVGGNAILFVSLQFTIAINAGILNSFEPLLIIFAGWAIFKDRVSKFQVSGVLISLMGVLALLCRGDPRRLLELELNTGDLLVLLAYISWAFYAVYLRLAPRDVDSKVMLFLILALGSALLIPFHVAEWVAVRPMVFNQATVLSIVVLAVFSSVASIFLWNYSIHRMGAARASAFIHLIVAYTIVLAIIFLGETFAWFHGMGLGLIGVGIYLSSRRGRTDSA